MANKQYAVPQTGGAGGSGGGGLQSATITILPTQIKALDNTTANAVTILAAPASGTAYLVKSVITNLQYGGTPYATGTGNLILGINSSGSTASIYGAMLTSALLTSSASQIQQIQPASIVSNALANFNGQALYLNTSNGTSYTAGNSTIVVNIQYVLIAVA